MFISCAQTQQVKDFEVIGPKKDFKRLDKLSITVINYSNDKRMYYVGLEAYYNGSWHPALVELNEKAPLNGAFLLFINANDSSIINYPPLNIFKIEKSKTVDSSKINEKYRIVVNYKDSSQIEFRKAYSSEFVLKE
jgi:plasmid maintenance system killer protein